MLPIFPTWPRIVFVIVRGTKWIPGRGDLWQTSVPLAQNGASPQGSKELQSQLRRQPVRKVKETSSACGQGTQEGKVDTVGQGAHYFRGNLGSAPADPCYLGKQPMLLGLQEQNSRFLYKISLFL